MTLKDELPRSVGAQYAAGDDLLEMTEVPLSLIHGGEALQANLKILFKETST